MVGGKNAVAFYIVTIVFGLKARLSACSCLPTALTATWYPVGMRPTWLRQADRIND